MHFTHRGNALHPMGEVFPQDSSRKPYKNHRIRLPAGYPFSPHREIWLTLWVGFYLRIPRRRNPDSCVLSAGFLLLVCRIPPACLQDSSCLAAGFLAQDSRGQARGSPPALAKGVVAGSDLPSWQWPVAVTCPAKAQPSRRSRPSMGTPFAGCLQ